ncbi:MAG: site-specific integrase [Candidatus Dormibacteraeota bacterium]|jgi:integrase|nr:site-specific integrase [Candidatus Dormibacteraeota bacterium]
MQGGFRTKADAVEALQHAQAAAVRSVAGAPSALTVAAYLDAWLAGRRDAGAIRATTATAYAVVIRVHLSPRIGRIPLVRLGREQITSCYRDLKASGRADGGDAGLSQKSMYNIHLVLRKALADAVDAGYLEVNPAVRAWTAPRAEATMRTWTEDEAAQFVRTLFGQPDAALYRLALATGMRRGELLGLRWRDLDLDSRSLSVSQQVVRAAGSLRVGSPKTAASRRRIALDADTVEVLRGHRRSQAVEKLQAGRGQSADDLVFGRPDGTPRDPDVVSHRFRNLVAAAKLPVIRLHDLRHTHASLLLARGTNPKVVQERLGHASVAITLDLYSHVVPDLQAEAALKIGAALRAPGRM